MDYIVINWIGEEKEIHLVDEEEMFWWINEARIDSSMKIAICKIDCVLDWS